MVLSGILAMIDAAVLSISYAEVEEMVSQGKWGAIPLRAVSRRLTRAVVVIVIATNTVNILGPILVGMKAVALYGSDVIGVITALLTFLTILFSEIIPKALGTHYAPVISRLVAPIVFASIVLLYPVIIPLEFLVGLFKRGKRRIGTEEQIRALARAGGGAGHIRQAEGELIHRVFLLNDRRAHDLMTPRKRVIAVKAERTVREALGDVSSHMHSRYPVYVGSLDDVRGVIMNRDLHEAVARGEEDQPILSIARPVLTVEGSLRSDALLLLFRNRKVHLAVVRENHKTIGIVSLEDVLEELVGEIEDEREAGQILT